MPVRRASGRQISQENRRGHLLNRTELAEQIGAEPGFMPAETILEIDNLQTHFFTPSGVVRAVDGVSYAVRSHTWRCR